MRITDMTALSGFARSTAEAASDFATLVYNLVLDIRDSYRPGVHCMRGPGPKCRERRRKRGQRQGQPPEAAPLRAALVLSASDL